MITPDSLLIVSQLANSSNNTSTTPTDNSGPPVEMPSLWDILEQYPTYLWSKYLGLYVYPVIILLGTIGNFISFIVMVRKTMIHSSTCFYLAVISVVDTMVLFFSGIRSWFSVINGWDAIILSPTACKVFNFFTYFFFQYSAWLLVAMTIERFIAIHFPLKAVEFATVSRAKKVTIGLFVLFVLINSHFFWTVTISGQYCSPTEDYEDFHDDVFPLIDATLYSFIPFLVLLTINVLIIRDNKRATRFRETLRRRSHTENEKTMENRHFHQKLTIMLLSVTFTFLVTSAPRVILFCIRYNYFDFSSYPIDFERLALYLLVSRITSLFSYMNHAVNFLLYCITGQRFRRELRKLFVCRKQSQTGTLYSTSTDRYHRRPSSTSSINMELSENHSYSTHVSHDTSYNMQASHTQSNITGSSQIPSSRTQTKHSQNPDTTKKFTKDLSQIPDKKFPRNLDKECSQNSENDSHSELSHNFNPSNRTELPQNFNGGIQTDFGHNLNVGNLAEFLQNMNKVSLTKQLPTFNNLTEISPTLNEDNLTEHSPTLNEDNLTEHSPTLNIDNLTEHSPTLNEDNLTEHSLTLNEDILTEHSLNKDNLTEHSPTLNEDNLKEHSPTLNEDNLTEHSLNKSVDSLTKSSSTLNEDSQTTCTKLPQNLDEDVHPELSQNSNTEQSNSTNKAISTALSQDMNKNPHTTLSQNIFSITNREL